ncbi:MAG TPA: prolyl oligopeptidase family serine peptidase [Chthoniobacterales bacterium]|jgi:prolyl oligopeptidase|nr:prolyl oligopeptidase family serine peptidase [Chthoniobacterales bacterium]
MRRKIISLSILAPIALIFAADSPTQFKYPTAPTSDQVDDYNGVKVADPYRPLENPDSPESRKWIEAENQITFDFLKTIPERDGITKRLTEVWDYERFGVPFKEKDRYFFSKNSGLQNQNVLFTAANFSEKPRVLFDPNLLAQDGTVALADAEVTDDAKLMAYGLATAGSDWQQWKVRDVATGKDRQDLIDWVKFSNVSWKKDASGFFYSRYDKPDEKNKLRSQVYNHKLFFHQLGTPQSQDKLIYERTDQKEWLFNAGVTDDGRYLIITVQRGTDPKNRIFFKNLVDPNSKVVELLDKADAEYSFIDNDGPVFIFRTNLNAPLGRVISINTCKSLPAKIDEVIPESKDKLEAVSSVGDHFVALYLKDAHSAVRLFKFDGSRDGEITLPGLGTAGGFTGKRKDRETFYSFASYTTPTEIFRYDFDKSASALLFKPKAKFNPDDYTTEQVFYKSADGTRVPMFVSYKKGMKRDGQNPTYLYGYGGFDISQTPGFKPENLVWMEMGGIYAVANLRGGGEYGEKWHEAGMLNTKQNVFDDFIAAAQYLIDNKFTSTPKLAIGGGSNGGLLVGACMTQRPDLYGAALPNVGVMDMLRFDKFTIGWAWTSDYGSPQKPDNFNYLYTYSPLHHIAKGCCYPPTMITTADHDDRVVPAHSFKFAATLQAAQGCDKPTLIRVETKAGHGAGKPTTKIIEETADRWAFLVKELGVKFVR